jgi:hypothetical protein
MNPNNNPWIDPNVSKFFNECVDREFRPNAIANEIDSLREQQEYQFYVQQGLETRLREESERPRTSKLYVQRSQEPSPERKAAIIDLVNTLESNPKDDSFSMSEITALVLFTGLIASIVGGLMFVVLP